MIKSKTDENKIPEKMPKSEEEKRRKKTTTTKQKKTKQLNNRLYQKLTRKFGESWHHNTSLQIWNCNESKQYWSRLSMRWPLAYLFDTYVGSEPQEMKNLVCKLQRKQAKNADQYCQWTMHWHIHVTHVLGATHKRWKTLWKSVRCNEFEPEGGSWDIAGTQIKHSLLPQHHQTVSKTGQKCRWQISFLEMIWRQSWVQPARPKNSDWIMSCQVEENCIFPGG